MPTTAPDTASATSLVDKIPTLDSRPASDLFLQETPWTLYISLGAGGLCLIILILWLLLRKRKTIVPTGPTPQQIALASLEALPADKLNLKDMSIELSLIIRRFITGETDDPALFETQQELNQRMNALANLPKSCQQRCLQLLDQLASNKYAGSQQRDAMQNNNLLQQAVELVQLITAEQERLLAEKSTMSPTS